MKRAKTRHALAAIYALVTLLVGAVSVPTASAEDKEYTPPKLVWERTFKKNILGVGVDEECFVRRDRDITACLKWILFRGEGLRWLDENGAVTPDTVSGYLHAFCVSPNGRYFCVKQAEDWQRKGIIHYTVLDWDGNKIWEVDEGNRFPCIRNDGSAVFPLLSYEYGFWRAFGVRWFDKRGRLTNSYRFSEVPYPWGRVTATSDTFFAMTTAPPGEGLHVSVFDRAGRLVWQRDGITGMSSDKEGRPLSYMHGGIVVTDHGEVLMLLSGLGSWNTQVLVFDKKGKPRDSLLLDPTGSLSSMKADGRLVFVSTGPSAHQPGLFLCYDFERMKVRFLSKGKDGGGFEHLEVNARAGLVAGAVHARDEERDRTVRIYDLDGSWKTEVVIETEVGPWRDFLIKLLDGALLVAEGNKLRLYEIDVE